MRPLILAVLLSGCQAPSPMRVTADGIRLDHGTADQKEKILK